MTTAFGPTQTEAIYPKGVERHWWPAARNRIIERGVRAAAGAERGPILEIGCGTGVVVDHLASRGWDITGCDLAPADPATARVASRLRLGVDAFDLLWTYFGYVDDDDDMTAHRLRQLNLFGPGGLVSMEDAEAIEITHQASRNETPDATTVIEAGGKGEVSDRA